MCDSIKQQLIQDLQLAGLAHSTQERYLELVVRFVRHTRTRPQDATEAQVAEYLRGLINQGKCQGTVRPIRSALQFVFQNTLARPWGLFKKGYPPRAASVCPMPPAAQTAAASSPRFTIPCTGLA